MLSAMSTWVITGANRGIGLELCRQAKAGGHDVIAACRRSSPQLEQTGARIVTGIDVADDGVGAALREAVGDTPVDVLVNNAGILQRETLDDLRWDQIRAQFEINALGPLKVTHALIPNLGQGSKIAMVTSRMGSIEDNTSGSRYGYRMSKVALNMAAVSLAHDLRDRGIAVLIVHPGFVRTDMTGKNGQIEPAQAAAGILQRIDDLDLSSSGTFWHQNGDRLPW